MLRFGLGVVLLAHGSKKLFGGVESTTQFFASIGIRPSRLFAYLVGLTEFVGGALLFVGLLVQLVALLFSFIMIVAIVKVRFSKGFIGGYELEFSLLLMSFALLLLGPGAYSIDLPF